MLAEYLRDIHYQPEQVQDFYPTPGTLSTAMFYTGLDPRTMEPVYVPKTKQEKAMQRALLQYRNPKKYEIVYDALVQAGREDLIGYGPKCLIRPKEDRYKRSMQGQKDGFKKNHKFKESKVKKQKDSGHNAQFKKGPSSKSGKSQGKQFGGRNQVQVHKTSKRKNG